MPAARARNLMRLLISFVAALAVLAGVARPADSVLRYARDLQLAEREMLDRNFTRARELLDGCPERLRGWEWHLLDRKLRRPPAVSLPTHLPEAGMRPAISLGYRSAVLQPGRVATLGTS